jgi:hypothetical protein
MSILNDIDNTFLRGDAYTIANKMYDQIVRFLQNYDHFDKLYNSVMQQKGVLKWILHFYNISHQNDWDNLVTIYYLFNEIFEVIPVKKSNEYRLKKLFILDDEEFSIVSSTYFIKQQGDNYEYYVPNERFINELNGVLTSK